MDTMQIEKDWAEINRLGEKFSGNILASCWGAMGRCLAWRATCEPENREELRFLSQLAHTRAQMEASNV